MRKSEKIISVACMVLIALVAMSDGRAGSRIIMAYAKEYMRKKRRVTAQSELNEKQFQQALTRLKRDGLVAKEESGIWRIARKGKMEANRLLRGIERRESYPPANNGPIQTIVIFDIPEKQRDKRALVRSELAALEYKYIQKSVWGGSIPLPKKCIEYFRDIEALSYIKIFSIYKSGTIT